MGSPEAESSGAARTQILWMASHIAHRIPALLTNESSKQLARKVCLPLLQLINLEKFIVAHLAVCANANEALFEFVCD